MSLIEEGSAVSAGQLVADRLAVADVLAHYSYCLDTRQASRLNGEVFTPDVEADYGYGIWTGADKLVDWIGSVFARTPETMHQLGNVRVDVTGDRARSSCYVTAWHWLSAPAGADPARPADFVLGAVYLDHLRRTEDGWRIERRKVRKAGPSALLAGTMPDFMRAD